MDNDYEGYWFVTDASGRIDSNNFRELKTKLIEKAKSLCEVDKHWYVHIKRAGGEDVPIWGYGGKLRKTYAMRKHYTSDYILALCTAGKDSAQMHGSNWKRVRAEAHAWVRNQPKGTAWHVVYMRRDTKGAYAVFKVADGVVAARPKRYVAYLRPDFKSLWDKASFPDGRDGVYSDRDLAWQAIEKFAPRGTLAKVCQIHV